MKIIYCISFILLYSLNLHAQELELGIELRPRFEYRDGYKTPLTADQKPAAFISQRSRMYGLWKEDKVQVKLSIQNVRTWGDVATTTTVDKNALMVHEAWAAYQLNDRFSVRAGRQVISYDNQRIFGGLDWAQQGQSHDAVIFSIKPDHQKLDIGFALNDSEEKLAKGPYPVNNYKNMQYAWYHNDLEKIQFSVLAVNNGFRNELNKTQYLQTYGGDMLLSLAKPTTLHLAAYGQSGKRSDRHVAAYNLNADVSHKLDEAWKVSLGYEILSGTDQNKSTTVNNSFNPLFGTNHIFNGFMDYFYSGNHQNSVGLQDASAKVEYTGDNFHILLSPHIFATSAKLLNEDGQAVSAKLGHEWDLQASYLVHPFVKVTAGYSHLFGSSSLAVLKGANSYKHNNWAWLMISFQPKKIFTK